MVILKLQIYSTKTLPVVNFYPVPYRTFYLKITGIRVPVPVTVGAWLLFPRILTGIVQFLIATMIWIILIQLRRTVLFVPSTGTVFVTHINYYYRYQICPHYQFSVRMSSEREQKQLDDATHALAGRFQDIKTSLRNAAELCREMSRVQGLNKLHVL